MKIPQTTSQTIENVAKRVGLTYRRGMQDWAIEMVSAKDASRLIGFYDTFEKLEEKVVLMQLIIAAYDDYLQECHNKKQVRNPKFEADLVENLRKDWSLHRNAVKYWSVFDFGDGEAVDEKDGFLVTPLMRRLWREHNE